MTVLGAMQQILSIPSMGLSKKKTIKTTLKKVNLHLHFKSQHPKLLTPMLTHLINQREKTTTVNLLVHLKSQQQKFIETKFDTHNNLSINETDASTETSPNHAYQYLKPYCYHTKNISVDKLHRL